MQSSPLGERGRLGTLPALILSPLGRGEEVRGDFAE